MESNSENGKSEADKALAEAEAAKKLHKTS